MVVAVLAATAVCVCACVRVCVCVCVCDATGQQQGAAPEAGDALEGAAEDAAEGGAEQESGVAEAVAVDGKLHICCSRPLLIICYMLLYHAAADGKGSSNIMSHHTSIPLVSSLAYSFRCALLAHLLLPRPSCTHEDAPCVQTLPQRPRQSRRRRRIKRRSRRRRSRRHPASLSRLLRVSNRK